MKAGCSTIQGQLFGMICLPEISGTPLKYGLLNVFGGKRKGDGGRLADKKTFTSVKRKETV